MSGFYSLAKDILRPVLGFSLSTLIKSLRFGLSALGRESSTSFHNINPFETTGLRQIPEIGLHEILAGRTPTIRIDMLPYTDGSLPADQLVALLAILVAESPKQVLEVGTFLGTTTRMMAENLPQSVIHTLDLPNDFSAASDDSALPKDDFHLISNRRVGLAFEGLACAERIRQHFGDSAKWNFDQVKNTRFFFIDGSHTYEYVKNDTEQCLRICQERAIILWHDCDRYHLPVVRYLAELRARGYDVRRILRLPLAYLEYNPSATHL